MITISAFLDTYRKLEDAVRSAGYDSIKTYEETLSNEERASKLRFCRTTRNFLTHEKSSSDFAPVSDAMVAFLTEEIEALDKTSIPIIKKSILISKCLTSNNTIAEAASFLTKKKISLAPIFNQKEELVSVISQESIVKLIMKNMTPKTKLSVVMQDLKPQKGQVIKLPDTTPIKDIYKGIIVLTSKGIYIK